MTTEKFSNNADSTIAGGIDNVTDPVTFSVVADAPDHPSAGSAFPTAGSGSQFRVIVDSEIMLVTSRSGDSMTANRAQEGTAITAHIAGAPIRHVLTKESLRFIPDYPQLTVFNDHKARHADSGGDPLTWSPRWYNVREYGAVGDGVTDDATAIQAAINAASAAGGGIVYFPRGTYPVGTGLTGAAGVSFVGHPRASIIKVKNATAITALLIQNISNVSVRGLDFDLNKANQTNGGVDTNQLGIYVSCTSAHMDRIVIDDCYVYNGFQYGIRATAPTPTGTFRFDVRINGNTVEGCDIGIFCQRGTKLRVTDNTVTGSAQAGIQVASGWGDIIRGNNSSGNAKQGIVVAGTTADPSIGAKVYGNTGDNNGTNTVLNLGWGINISAFATRFAVTGNTNRNNYQGGITVDLFQAGSSTTIRDGYGSVTGNICSGFSGANASHGISLHGAGFVAVNGNTCEGNALQGIFANGHFDNISGNVLVNNGQYGLRVQADNSGALTPNPGNNTIGHNTYSGNGAGDFLERPEVVGTNVWPVSVHETVPQYADCDIAVFKDPDDSTTWIGRNTRTHADSYVDNTNNDPGVIISNAFGAGNKIVKLLDAPALKSPITVATMSLLVADWGPTWAGGILRSITPAGGYTNTDPLIQTGGNGVRFRGIVLDGNSACGWCLISTHSDTKFQDVSTYDGRLGGVTTSGARNDHMNPHYRQPNGMGYSLYITGGADCELGGDVKLSGSGSGADECAFRVAGAGFSVGGAVHITGADAAQQVCLIENDGGFSNVWRFDTAKAGHLIRIEGGGPVFTGCNFYSGGSLNSDNTWSVIRHNSGSIIQVIGCTSTIAGSPANVWKRFLETNGTNTKAFLADNKMGSIKTGNVPWNNVPMIHHDNSLNGVAYDPSANLIDATDYADEIGQLAHDYATDMASAAQTAAEQYADDAVASVVSQRTRTFFVPANTAMTADSATVGIVGSAPTAVPAARVDHGATQGVYCLFKVPSDAIANGALDIEIVYEPTGTDATPHTIRWSVNALAMQYAASIASAGTTTTWTGDSVARTAVLLMKETSQEVLASVDPDDLIRLNVRRVGGDAGDTYLANAQVLGVNVAYTALF